jgi:hypothetical protein
MVHYLLVKMTNQIVSLYFASQKDYLRYNGRVQTNLFRLIQWCFLTLVILGIFIRKSSF